MNDRSAAGQTQRPTSRLEIEGTPTMTDTANELPTIPGLDMVGRGIYIRPQQTFELKEMLFRQENYRIYPSKETGQSYRVPAGYEVNDSPPRPSTQALNQIMIEESWERFEKQIGTVSLSANLGSLAKGIPGLAGRSAGRASRCWVRLPPMHSARKNFAGLRP